VNNNTSWYNSSLFSAIIGGCVALIIFILGCIFNIKIQEKYNKKNFFILLIQQYNRLFSIIAQGVENSNNILYKELRQELDNNSAIIFLLPKELKPPFDKLIRIHYSGNEFYQRNKECIYYCLKEIVDILNNFGVDLFGFK
jgi:hypothetical protein